MQVRAWVEPSEGKIGDVVALRVQFAHAEEQIKSVYARTDQDSWQLSKEKKNEYSLSMQIPFLASSRTYNINIFA